MKRSYILLLLLNISILGYGQIIADHTVVDRYDDIPQYYIDQVKKMWLSYAGESHSQAIRDGFTALMGLNSIYGVNVRESGVPDGATSSNLRVSRATWGDYSNSTGWIYDYGEEDWFTNSTAISRTKAGISYCNNNNLSISAIGFGWCWDMSADNDVGGTIDPVYNVRWAGASKQGPQGDLRWGLDASDQTLTGNSVSLDTYLNATQQYIDYCTANGYTTKVFFTTGTVDTWSGTFGSENMYQAYLKNKRIRDYVTSDASRILFDYADILCYDDDGTPNTRTWDGHTFPAITTTNLGNTLVGHIGPAGALRLSKAMWWMLARIAGWDGGINNIPVEGVIVAGTQTISTDNGTTQLTATISPANATTQTVSWSISSGTTLATISATGLVTALNNGIVTARATSNDGTNIFGELVITITNQLLPVSVSISASATDVTAGTLVTFTATPTNGGTAPVYQWKVNNTNAGTNSSTFSYTPMASGVVTCVLTSNALNTTGNPATSNQLAITVITSPIGNNTINYTSSVQGTVCATAVEGSNAVLAAPSGAVFTSVDFASYGNPSGTCPVFILGSCNALTSKSVVEGYLLGKNSATIPATNVIFGDPCDGTYKRLYISATYSSTQSGMIIGSTPTGGTGIYSYLWESSITSAVSGFSPASGTNNTKDYTPGSLTQTTWFRRTVTSGGLSNTSLAIFINVGSGLPVSVSISASATDVTAGTLVTFTATPTNGGTAPVYQWKVNNTNAGTNSSTFSYTPMASGVVTCVLTSNALNTTGNPATSNQLAITVITSPIGNNTINYTSSVQGTVCATAVEGSNAVLAAPSGAVFTSVDFASYGNPSGTCPVFILGSCNALTSKSVVEGYLLGKNSATIPATNVIFGDPCDGTYKRLYISATYSSTQSGMIIGSTPTGGTGIYSYLWESSITSAVSGFSPASGTNNTKDYTPGSLTQTTWFRRTVTSGGLSNTSLAIFINVGSGLPVSVSISASATDVTAGTLVTFTATPTNGGTAPVYQWKVNNTNAGTNSSTFSYTPMASGVVTCVLTSNALNTTGNPATSNQLAITVITSPIGNNTINYTSSVQGTVCATAVEGSNAVLAAPSGAVFTSVDFASYGNPSGTCPVFILGSCNALTSKSVVEGYLLGKNSATIPATNVIFGDPCDGRYKRLYISATYSSTQSGMIIGSTPTGGTGIYSYLWESSITSAVSGFSPASGTNNTKDYTPGSLTQTTWFRRTVTSGGFSNISNVIEIIFSAKGVDLSSDALVYKENDQNLSFRRESSLLNENEKIDDIFDESCINIYPVPNNGHFTVTIATEDEKDIDIMVFNSSGKKVLEMNNLIVKERTEIPIDLVSLPAGIYYLKIISGNIQVIKKVILSR